jgi:hypothetical protein
MLVFLLCPLTVSACALIAGLGDVTLATSDAGESTTEDSGQPNPVTADSGTTDAGSTTTPTFCTGITLYASYDTKFTGDRGGDTIYGRGGVTQTASGKFGPGLSLMHDASAADDGAALYYVAGSAGNPWPESTGSLAVWYRQAPGTVWGAPAQEAPVLYRPVVTLPPATLQTAGLAYFLFGFASDTAAGVSGLIERSGVDQHPFLAFDQSAQAPYLRPNDFNHYFAAWQVNVAPTAFYAINGGLGVALNGAAPTYPEGDGGELHTPYKSFTSVQWVSEGRPIGFRLGGTGSNTPDGTLDDLVIWNRVITFDELAAVYSANRPVGDVCKLR